MALTYKLLNLHYHEKLTISVDGLTLHHDGDSSSDTYRKFEHSMKGNAQHVVDIMLLSDFPEWQEDFKSEARVLIQSASFEGT